MAASNRYSRLENEPFPVFPDVEVEIADGLSAPDYSERLELPVAELPADEEQAREVIRTALLGNQALLRRIGVLSNPFVFGVGGNALVLGGDEIPARTGASDKANHFAEAMSRAVDLRVNQLTDLRRFFINGHFPVTDAPIWIPGTEEVLPVPPRERRKGSPAEVRVADVISPRGWVDSARVNTQAGLLPAIVVQFVFDRD